MLEGENSIYSVGIYIRLSREDDDKVILSESIVNQKSLLLQYVKENNLKVYDIYIDDGYSGTNFDRPSFNRLLKDIEFGRVNMVITKDMSRLGRDYIGTGNLIEKYFPTHNVRYVSVTDNLDTFLDNSNNDIAPFKVIMNDMYAKDISKKIRASLRAKQKEGKWVGGRCPFGYMIDVKDKNHLIINKEQAVVVRKIYSMCLEGVTFFKIAKKLTSESVKTPSQYYNFEKKNNYSLYGEWNSKTIRDILTNRMYIGDMVQNKRSKVNYKLKKVIRNKSSDYIIVENTHKPIIDKDTFERVQNLLDANYRQPTPEYQRIFKGLMYCHECGHKIGVGNPKRDNRPIEKQYVYTYCNFYRKNSAYNKCTPHTMNYNNLEEQLMDIISNVCKKYIDLVGYEDIVEKRKKTLSTYTDTLEKKIGKLEIDIKSIDLKIEKLYMDRLDDIISPDTYKKLTDKFEEQKQKKQ